MRNLSLPREHGAHLTLAAAVVTATLSASQPVPALGMGIVLTMAFLARGPLERLAAGHALRAWDGPALGVMLGLAGVGALVVGLEVPGVWWLGAVAAAATVPAGAYLARRASLHRAAALEFVAMGALGASAGLAALCGGMAPARAIGLAAVLGAHAAVSVPMLRTEIRKRARVGRRGALLAAAGLLALVGAGLCGLGYPAMTLALVPRAAQIGLALLEARPAPRRPQALGLQETALLALAVAVLVVVSQ
jgi:hypothetical protein